MKEQTTIRLPAELKEQLQQEAERKGISLNALILMILNLERNRQEESHHVQLEKKQCEQE